MRYKFQKYALNNVKYNILRTKKKKTKINTKKIILGTLKHENIL